MKFQEKGTVSYTFPVREFVLRVEERMISSGIVVNDCMLSAGFRTFFIRISAACCPILFTLISTTVRGGSISWDRG